MRQLEYTEDLIPITSAAGFEVTEDKKHIQALAILSKNDSWLYHLKARFDGWLCRRLGIWVGPIGLVRRFGEYHLYFIRRYKAYPPNEFSKDGCYYNWILLWKK